MINFKDENEVEQFQSLIEDSLMKVWNHHMKPQLLNYNDEIGKQVAENTTMLERINGWLGMVYIKKYAFSFAGLLTMAILIFLLFGSFMI
jgi:cell division septum initiation protein DivIVA